MDIRQAREGAALAACAAGVIGTLGLYGVLQERMLAMPYDGEYFTSSAFLVLSNRLFGVVFALAMSVMLATEQHVRKPEAQPLVVQDATWLDYVLVSASNVLSTGCQYEAVKYLAYSVQMVGKSTKMLPVMYWGTLLARKTYSRTDWLLALIISAGCGVFLMGGSITSGKHGGGPRTEAVGLGFLGASLLSDGFTSMYQEQLFKRRVPMSSQMLYTNIVSAVIATAALVAQGDLFLALGFLQRHPEFCHDTIVLSIAAAAAQVCIYMTIARYGAVVLAAIVNVRQCVSIVLSNTLYHHALSALQVSGCTLMFVALACGHCERRLRSSAGKPAGKAEP